MNFSGKVWSNRGTTWLHFGSILVNRAMAAMLFFIYLSLTLRENGWTDLRDIFRERVEWPWGDLITFWVNSGKPRDAATLVGGVCCAVHHSLFYQFSRNYFSKVLRSEPAIPELKQNLTRNSHSRLFNDKHFGITEKLTAYRYIITLALSKFPKKIAIENAENYRCRQPHCRLTPPPQGTSSNIRINLISPETRVNSLQFCRWQYGSIFIQLSMVDSERRIFSATYGCQIERAYTTSS